MTFWENISSLCEERNINPANVTNDLGLANSAPTKWRNGTIPAGETLFIYSLHYRIFNKLAHALSRICRR